MTTKSLSHTYSARVLGEELIIRDEDTFDEYTRVIDADLCASLGEFGALRQSPAGNGIAPKGAVPSALSHTIFAYPRAVAIIREILDKHLPQFKIEANPASKAIITATFFASTIVTVSPSLSINIEDSLVIDCAIKTGNPETRALAKLDSTVAELRAALASATVQIKSLVAESRNHANSILLLDKIRAFERLFGVIPPGLYKSAEAVMLSEINGTLRTFPAMSNHDIWMTRKFRVSIEQHMLREPCIRTDHHSGQPSLICKEMRHWTCLAWVPTVVRVFECDDPLWAQMLKEIRASRIIFAPAITGVIATAGSSAAKTMIALSSEVRSLVFAITTGQSVDWKGLWSAISTVINPRDGLEIILPTIMRDNIPGGVVVGSNIKYESDTFAAIAAPTTWHAESHEVDFARAEASLAGFKTHIEAI